MLLSMIMFSLEPKGIQTSTFLSKMQNRFRSFFDLPGPVLKTVLCLFVPSYISIRWFELKKLIISDRFFVGL